MWQTVATVVHRVVEQRRKKWLYGRTEVKGSRLKTSGDVERWRQQIFRLVEIRSAFYLYLHRGLEYFN